MKQSQLVDMRLIDLGLASWSDHPSISEEDDVDFGRITRDSIFTLALAIAPLTSICQGKVYY